jgi:hypothetical protein
MEISSTKSIYVAISSLDDSELLPTLLDLYYKSSGKYRVTVGLSISATTDSYAREVQILVDKFGYNIKFSYSEVTPTTAAGLLGVGRSRKAALSYYDDEDYVLQIDSHSLFATNWDETLVDIFERASSEIGGLVVITAYAGAYGYKNGRREFGAANRTGSLMYPYFCAGEKFWGAVPPWKFIEVQDMHLGDALYAPCTKFNANMAFSSGEFALDCGLPDDIVFYEEEIVQTLELAKRGYAIIFPNIRSVFIGHLYKNHVESDGSRKNIMDYGLDPETLMDIGYDNYCSYISDPKNQKIIDRYNTYIGNGFNLRDAGKLDIPRVPDRFRV